MILKTKQEKCTIALGLRVKWSGQVYANIIGIKLNS